MAKWHKVRSDRYERRGAYVQQLHQRVPGDDWLAKTTDGMTWAYVATAQEGMDYIDSVLDGPRHARETHEDGTDHIAAIATMAEGLKVAEEMEEDAKSFQSRVERWIDACFGHEVAADRMERNHRFLEEALELVQANGCTEDDARQLVSYVYGRDKGELGQEVGGVMLTLSALCSASGVDMEEAAETELARVWTKVETIRAKQAAKPKHSPLPQHVEDRTPAATLLHEAAAVVDGHRNGGHGHPERTLAKIAEFWSLYLEADVFPADVARMMELLKIARGTDRDSCLDAAGYAALAWEVSRDDSEADDFEDIKIGGTG